jgi:hypothetical protein
LDAADPAEDRGFAEVVDSLSSRFYPARRTLLRRSTDRGEHPVEAG